MAYKKVVKMAVYLGFLMVDLLGLLVVMKVDMKVDMTVVLMVVL